MDQILVVGENSFIGKEIKGNNVDIVSYKNFDDVNLFQYKTIVNCALNPLYKIQKYDESIDVDFQIAKKANDFGCHYIMISTRKVYSPTYTLQVMPEDYPLGPYEYYGENKLTTENKLLENFSEVTILRGSNIFGYEYGRNSFVGHCMTQLVNLGKIVYDISPFTIRDFLPVEDAARLIKRTAEVRPKGIFNLSSHYGLQIGTVAEHLIKGYGYGGRYVIEDDKLADEFILDNSKLLKALKEQPFELDYDKKFQRLGELLWQRT